MKTHGHYFERVATWTKGYRIEIHKCEKAGCNEFKLDFELVIPGNEELSRCQTPVEVPYSELPQNLRRTIEQRLDEIEDFKQRLARTELIVKIGRAFL